LKERFNAHINLKNNVEFVQNIVDLVDLLSEYRELRGEPSDELKTFYLNEILVSHLFLKLDYKLSRKKSEILEEFLATAHTPNSVTSTFEGVRRVVSI
jgi:hypothetical protein